ncbi:hypothetical protein K8R43_03735 [archaeon]|nr:hypothetical protein [archaeon]
MVFKGIIDAFTKSKLIKEAYRECNEMHHEVEAMFHSSFDCFQGKCSLEDVKKEDKEVNKKLVSIRLKVMEYLSSNDAPDLNAALEITAIANEYERIGDYCKDIAELRTLYKVQCEGECELCEITGKMQEIISKQFAVVHDAIENEDEKLAKKSDVLNEEVKVIRMEIIDKINKNPRMNAKKAVICSKIAAYSRRISSHLENISSVITNPYPEMGFRLGKYTDFED